MDSLGCAKSPSLEVFKAGHVTQCHGLIDKVAFSHHCDLMISEVFCNRIDLELLHFFLAVEEVDNYFNYTEKTNSLPFLPY